MRVIAGEARGTRLVRPPGGTRPLSDRAREGLFSSLGGRVDGAACLDLFAGTGSIGIEALSRGASSCRFVERNPVAIRALRRNLGHTRLEARSRITRGDVERFLGRTNERYDLAFLDPPYALARVRLRAILESLGSPLGLGGAFALHLPRRTSTDVIPLDFEIRRRLTYGDTLILICGSRS
ncbi:MAG: RsmD family RNA methyltransferase [Actinomycetota bacterium]